MQSIAFRPPSPREGRIASVDHGSSQPHNLEAARVRSQVLCGIEVHCVQQDALPGRAWHQLSNRHPMLAIVWNEAGGLSEARPSLHSSANRSNLRRHRRIGQSSLIPAGLPVWCYSDQISRVEAVRLILDVDRVFEVMGGEFQVARLAEPRLTFFDGVGAAPCFEPGRVVQFSFVRRQCRRGHHRADLASLYDETPGDLSAPRPHQAAANAGDGFRAR
jgi:hypothetical protein